MANKLDNLEGVNQNKNDSFKEPRSRPKFKCAVEGCDNSQYRHKSINKCKSGKCNKHVKMADNGSDAHDEKGRPLFLCTKTKNYKRLDNIGRKKSQKQNKLKDEEVREPEEIQKLIKIDMSAQSVVASSICNQKTKASLNDQISHADDAMSMIGSGFEYDVDKADEIKA
jgi:hypothetical protein